MKGDHFDSLYSKAYYRQKPPFKSPYSVARTRFQLSPPITNTTLAPSVGNQFEFSTISFNWRRISRSWWAQGIENNFMRLHSRCSNFSIRILAVQFLKQLQQLPAMELYEWSTNSNDNLISFESALSYKGASTSLNCLGRFTFVQH